MPWHIFPDLAGPVKEDPVNLNIKNSVTRELVEEEAFWTEDCPNPPFRIAKLSPSGRIAAAPLFPRFSLLKRVLPANVRFPLTVSSRILRMSSPRGRDISLKESSMTEQEGTPKKTATVKKAATPKAEKAEAVAGSKPKAPAKTRKAAAPKKELASVTPIDMNREPATLSPSRVSSEEIARLAHQYWLERGRQHGRDAEDWFRAEQELRSKAS